MRKLRKNLRVKRVIEPFGKGFTITGYLKKILKSTRDLSQPPGYLTLDVAGEGSSVILLKTCLHLNLWGCDPVPEMIQLCEVQNKWASFKLINPNPPTSFPSNHFDMIYSFSVFSHLSEDFHFKVLNEIKRILKPGGIYMTTTRNRNFIYECR